jgi:hypothetical protein
VACSLALGRLAVRKWLLKVLGIRLSPASRPGPVTAAPERGEENGGGSSTGVVQLVETIVGSVREAVRQAQPDSETLLILFLSLCLLVTVTVRSHRRRQRQSRARASVSEAAVEPPREGAVQEMGGAEHAAEGAPPVVMNDLVR